MHSAPDNVPRADEIRTLIKDIWDLRIAKLRSSIDVFVKSEATHAKVLHHCLCLSFTIVYDTSWSFIQPSEDVETIAKTFLSFLNNVVS